MKKLFIVFSLLISSLGFSQVNIFIISVENGVPKIEKETISKDETKVFLTGTDSGILTLVYPTGAGLSGDFVKLADKRTLVVRCANDELFFGVQKDGELKKIVSTPVSDLSKYDYRINLVSNNLKRAFKISSYETISEDKDAPVMNMFGDKISPQENEFIVTTEIKEALSGYNQSGKSEVRFTGNYFISTVKVGGKEYDFVIDLAATNSFVTKNIIPAGIKTEDLTAKQYSAEGIQTIESPLAGFGGKINNLQVCNLPSIEIGDIKLFDNIFYVTDKFFEVKGKRNNIQIEGIIGMDILQKFGTVSFQINESKPVSLIFGEPAIPDKHSIEIPFTIANGHTFIKGKIGGSDVNFILDTGSPFSFIQSEIAGRENIKGEKSFTVKGADGKEVETLDAKIKLIKLEGNPVANFEAKIVDSPILAGMGLKESGGLLGNSFLKNYNSMAIDFTNQKILLYK